jgi:hypothetical protein
MARKNDTKHLIYNEFKKVIDNIQRLSYSPPAHKMQAYLFLADRQQLSEVRDLIRQPEEGFQFKHD